MAKEQNNQPQQEQDINQLLKVRREKLANLQAAGKDPFKITKYDVTHHSTDIKDHFEEMEGKQVSIQGTGLRAGAALPCAGCGPSHVRRLRAGT